MRPATRLFQVVAPEIVARQLSLLNHEAQKPIWKYTRTNDEKEGPSLLEAAFRFRKFSTTWRFLNFVALAASKQRHHPTIETTYNTVNMRITTHDAGNRVTNKDLQLLEAVQAAYRFVKAAEMPSKLEPTRVESRPIDPLQQASRIIDEMVKTR